MTLHELIKGNCTSISSSSYCSHSFFLFLYPCIGDDWAEAGAEVRGVPFCLSANSFGIKGEREKETEQKKKGETTPIGVNVNINREECVHGIDKERTAIAIVRNEEMQSSNGVTVQQKVSLLLKLSETRGNMTTMTMR